MRVVASIQARMGSSRLPGKVLKPLQGKPMLLWQVERLRRSRLIDEVVVATTTSSGDDAIVEFCQQHEVSVYRGSEDDVLGRIAGLIREYRVDIHAEFCGDSPLTDPGLVDQFIGCYLKDRDSFQCVSNALETSYPPGQEVIVYPGSVLLDLDAELPAEDVNREHVGYNITRFPERFRVRSMYAPKWLYEPEIYLEVDTLVDFQVMDLLLGWFVEAGYEHFSLEQIIDVMRSHPEWVARNSGEERRWKAYRIEADD